MEVGRAIGRLSRRALGSGPAAGALVLACFFGVDFVGAKLDFMGFSADERSTSLILHRYGRQIALDQLRILATYLLVGGVLGGIGAFLGAARDRARAKAATPTRRAVRGIVAALVGHGYFFLRSLIHYPQLYSEAFYDRGGLRRALMATLTSRLTVRRLDVALAALLLTALAPLLARLPMRALVARARTRLRVVVEKPAWPTSLLLLALLVTAAAWMSGHHRRPNPGKPNVLLLAVDSLRADRVFGAACASRFPNLSALAARGVRFREAHVTVPRTFPSFVTLLTGRYPHHHGIRHMFPSAAQRAAIGPALPQLLHDHGYRTTVISDYAGEIFSRTPLGFDRADVPYFDMKTIVAQRGLQVHPNVLPYATSELGRHFFAAVDALPELSDPARLAKRAVAELRRSADRPLFLTVFFSAAHFPYAAPDPYYRRFAQPDYDGPYRYQKPPLAPAPADERDAQQIRALYDGAVAATDAAVGQIVDELRRDRLDDNTIIILLADHGENLYDLPERGMGHGDHLRGSAADHVPWVWLDPRHRFATHDVPGIVRDVDMVPTLAALLGLPPPPSDGFDLTQLLRGERASLDLDAYAETELWFTSNGPGFAPDERLPYPNITGTTDLAPDDDVFLKPEWQDMVVVAKHRAVRTDRWKLLYRPTRAGARFTLYDLEHDPDERLDVAAAHPDLLHQLKEKLRAWILDDPRMAWRGDFAVPR